MPNTVSTSHTSTSAPWSFKQALRVFWMVFKNSLLVNESDERNRAADQSGWGLCEKRTNSDHILHGIRAGKGSKTFIFLHGTPAHARKWDWYLDNVPHTHNILTLDRPGFGLNNNAHIQHDISDQAEMLSHWLKDESEPVIVVGHSFGGAVAAQLAVEYPEKIKGVVLLAASLDAQSETVHPLQYLGCMPPFSWLLPKAIRHSNAELLKLKSGLIKLQPKLINLHQPVFIIHARDDDLASFANVEYYRQNMTNSSFIKEELLEEGGHFIPWNKSEWVLEKLLEFEKECER